MTFTPMRLGIFLLLTLLMASTHLFATMVPHVHPIQMVAGLAGSFSAGRARQDLTPPDTPARGRGVTAAAVGLSRRFNQVKGSATTGIALGLIAMACAGVAKLFSLPPF